MFALNAGIAVVYPFNAKLDGGHFDLYTETLLRVESQAKLTHDGGRAYFHRWGYLTPGLPVKCSGGHTV
jgi:hypothetical protein